MRGGTYVRPANEPFMCIVITLIPFILRPPPKCDWIFIVKFDLATALLLPPLRITKGFLWANSRTYNYYMYALNVSQSLLNSWTFYLRHFIRMCTCDAISSFPRIICRRHRSLTYRIWQSRKTWQMRNTHNDDDDASQHTSAAMGEFSHTHTHTATQHNLVRMICEHFAFLITS